MAYNQYEGNHYAAAGAAPATVSGGGVAGGGFVDYDYGHHQAPHQTHHHHRNEVKQQISRHHDLERGLNRMEESQSSTQGQFTASSFLAQVVMEECREAKIRRQNRQVAISAGIAIGLIVAVIWFVVTR